MEVSACIFVGGPIQHAIRPDGAFHSGTRSIIELAIGAIEASGHTIFRPTFMRISVS